MSIKVAINGFGRIGRLALRQIEKAKGIEVVAVNDLTPADMLLHLFKYDSTQGRFQGTAELKDDAIVVNGKEIKVFANPNPEELPWGELGVDVVLECTGFFTSKTKAEAHPRKPDRVDRPPRSFVFPVLPEASGSLSAPLTRDRAFP